LNKVRYSELYLEDTSQQVDSGIGAWIKCVTVNFIWKILHSMWTVVLQLEWSGLQWTLSGSVWNLIKTTGYACVVFYSTHTFNYQMTPSRSARQYTADINKW